MKTKFLNNPTNISEAFYEAANEYYLAGPIKQFDAKTGKGIVEWQYHRYQQDWFFNKIDQHLEFQSQKSAPIQDYDTHPLTDFELSFVTERTVRLRMKTSAFSFPENTSLMIEGTIPEDQSRTILENGNEIKFQNTFGSVVVNTQYFSIQFIDKNNRLLTGTQTRQPLKAMHSKAMPFCFVRRISDYSKSVAASFSLSPEEKIYGCGESFTQLNKRGQKLELFATDAQSTASNQMYKPIPFFMSSRGYGMFVHTTAPLTFDFGYIHSGTTTLFSGDEELDLFFFFGSPREILSEYTALTGRSPLPPLWSFGLWMGTFSFTSEAEVKEVATLLRKNHFPCDVIHIDAGWFENGINCDFRFNEKKFPEPEKMMNWLKENHFKTSLWQIPYFTPHNPLFSEIVEKKLYIKNALGHVPTEDAILDLSNPDTIQWYSDKLKALLKKGASVIKADFGEAAPLNGLYASGSSGFFEHNLYPLRYNKLVSELTQTETGESIIWARSAWAGSQKYPVHWGGDAEVSDAGMAGTLRGGLSLGLCGFSFWSHDIGGFSGSPVEELYSRWAFFGLMSSHSRIHGFPPREPWKYSETFQTQFRKISELRYRLLPYIFTQAYLSSQSGLPLMKTLFLNYPQDPTAWSIDDQYLFGDDLLIAPFMETGISERMIYLPEGKWINIHSNQILEGRQWMSIEGGDIRGILLLRYGALIPSTKTIYYSEEIDWNNIEWIACSDGDILPEGKLFSPGMKAPVTLIAARQGNKWEVTKDDQQSDYNLIGYEEFLNRL